MLTTIRKSALTVAALGAVGLGAAGIAGAAGDATSSTSPAKARSTAPAREALSSEAAAKVKAAALEKVPGATVVRVEGGGPYATPYHAHIETSDGTRKVVLVNASFEATAVQAERRHGGRRGPGGPGHDGRGGPGAGEKALTGDTKSKVEAAVLAKYDGATILRTETNGDGAAPYESHIETSSGEELEVLVNKDFGVVEARERPARP